MAVPITIPRLGWNMEEGTFAGWLKADGDPVRPGEPLFALETEKATEEVEGLDTGYLRIQDDGPKPGDRLTVGTVIAYVVATIDEPLPATPAQAAAAPAVTGEAKSVPVSRERERPEKAISSPRARRTARDLGVDWRQLDGSGRNGRVRERDVRAACLPSPPVLGEEGLGVRGVDASLRAGLVPPGAGRNPTHPQPLSPRSEGRGEQEGSAIPITPLRRTIATRMLESRHSTAPVTLTTTVDATNLVNLRAHFKAAGSVVPSYTDLFIKLTATALTKHPMLTGQWTDTGIRLPVATHIGIAVDTEAGLLVPVVRDVGTLGIRDLATATRGLVERARAGRLSSADMQGGCFTVTNLGAFGIDAFTPIINPPECAVLGVGRIAKRPAVVGDAVVPRDQITLSLTFDHRVVDGAPAARFLQTLGQAVENPGPWING